MASSRYVGYTEAKPKVLKISPFERLKFGLTKFTQGQTGKRKESLKKAKEDFGHNVNFAVTNQLVHAGMMLLTGAAIATGVGVLVGFGRGLRGEEVFSGVMSGGANLMDRVGQMMQTPIRMARARG